jgi:YVTN family beta-propeller protein
LVTDRALFSQLWGPRKLLFSRRFYKSAQGQARRREGLSFDGFSPGPTYHAFYGQPVLVRNFNDLQANNGGFGLPSVSTHLHNGHTPSESDGFPCDFFERGHFYDQHYPQRHQCLRQRRRAAGGHRLRRQPHLGGQPVPGQRQELSPVDGSLVGTFTVGQGPVALLFDGLNLWTANYQGDTVTKLDTNGVVKGTYKAGQGPGGLLFDGANIWVMNRGSTTVTKLDSRDGAVLATFAVGDGPFGIAYDGANIWVANFFSASLTKLDRNTGAVLATVKVGDGPAGLTFAGADLWVSNHGSNTVARVRPRDGLVLATYRRRRQSVRHRRQRHRCLGCQRGRQRRVESQDQLSLLGLEVLRQGSLRRPWPRISSRWCRPRSGGWGLPCHWR